MNPKEQYELLFKNGVSTPPEEELIATIVNRLIDSLYKPDEEHLFVTDKKRLAEFGIEKEPINFGNLKVSEVQRHGDSWKVVIEEASPSDCPSFCAYIEKFMAAWGWSVIVETEW